MYVRWQHVPLISQETAPLPGDISHKAYLMQSKRRGKDGEPRTRIIAYLGCIHASQMDDALVRQTFLDTAYATVRTYCRDGLQRKNALTKLKEVVQGTTG